MPFAGFSAKACIADIALREPARRAAHRFRVVGREFFRNDDSRIDRNLWLVFRYQFDIDRFPISRHVRIGGRHSADHRERGHREGG